jgi:hypothetical protein
MNELNAVLELGKPARTPRGLRRRRGVMRAFVGWLRGDHQPSAPATGEISGQQASDAPERETGDAADPHGSAAAPALALNSALDSLGRAHHRPYSRA